MLTRIHKSFIVENKVDDVWQLLTDPQAIATCIPGAAIHEKVDDTTSKGSVQLKLGPVKAGFDGIVTFLIKDFEKKVFKLKGTGTDLKGKGGAEMVLTGGLFEKDGKTEVTLSMELSITGLLAQFGSRLIGDLSHRVVDHFIDNLKAKLNGSKIDPGLHTSSVIGSAMKGLFGRAK